MMLFFIICLLILCVVQMYIIRNLLGKIKVYEESVEQFYSALTVTLANMRLIDSRQMFETDDEVGTVFQQLVDILANLRPILYGMEPDEDKKN
jgi:hypothetical protein